MRDIKANMDGEEGRKEMSDEPDTLLQTVTESARRMRIASPLSDEAEDAMSRVIGAALAVHSALGPGFLESIYQRAMLVELNWRSLAVETERSVKVKYRDAEIGGQRVDLIVEGLVIVELKCVRKLEEIHRAQLISYLKATGLRGGLLINFQAVRLKDGGLQRIVL